MNKEMQIEEMEKIKQVLVDYCMKHSLMFSFEALRKYCEVLHNTGYCRMPCKVGDTVYAVLKPIFEDEKAVIEEWQVKVIVFDGVKWYAENVDGEAFEVGGDYCKLTREEAERELERVEIHEK